MRSTLAASSLACLVLSCSAPGFSLASSDALRIDGDVTELTLSIDDLEQLDVVEVEWNHRGETRTFQAIPLESLLRSVGVEPGAMISGLPPADVRPGWKLAVIATASDGFQATFSVAELFHGMGQTEAYVALRENGQPLGDVHGPLRLIVPSDGEGSRCVHDLQRLTIVDLRHLVPGPRPSPFGEYVELRTPAEVQRSTARAGLMPMVSLSSSGGAESRFETRAPLASVR